MASRVRHSTLLLCPGQHLTSMWMDIPGLGADTSWNSERAVVQGYIYTILHRNNTLVDGGLLYKDDPTVLAWELQNEPQLREGYEACARLHAAQQHAHSDFALYACGVDCMDAKSCRGCAM